LSDRHIVRAAKDCPVIEHNDGPALFPNRLRQAVGFVRQAPNSDPNFQTNWIGTRRLAGFIFRVLGSRTRLARAIHSRGVFDRKCHGIPIMNGHAHRDMRAPSECRYFRLCRGWLAIVRGYYIEPRGSKEHSRRLTRRLCSYEIRVSDDPPPGVRGRITAPEMWVKSPALQTAKDGAPPLQNHSKPGPPVLAGPTGG
jgi:hypothetical protein